MTKTKTISIQDQSFTVSAPYEAGHVLTEVEAAQLNQVRAENIANNFRKLIKEAVEGKEGAKTLDEIREAFAEYDAKYVFSLGAGRGSSPRLSPLEAEALRVAKEWLMIELRKKGLTMKAYVEANGKEAVAEKLSTIAGHEKIIALAKKNLANISKPEIDGVEI